MAEALVCACKEEEEEVGAIKDATEVADRGAKISLEAASQSPVVKVDEESVAQVPAEDTVAVKRGAFEEGAYEPNSSSAAGEEQLRAGEAVVGAAVEDEEDDHGGRGAGEAEGRCGCHRSRRRGRGRGQRLKRGCRGAGEGRRGCHRSRGRHPEMTPMLRRLPRVPAIGNGGGEVGGPGSGGRGEVRRVVGEAGPRVVART